MPEITFQGPQEEIKPEPKTILLYIKTVCWVCKRGNKTLRNVRDDRGKKTKIYACEDHYKIFGNPPTNASSNFEVRKEVK